MLASGIYYLSVVRSTNLMMRMMMEQPEHSSACALRPLRFRKDDNTTKNSIGGVVGQARQQSLDQPGTWDLVLHIVGLLLVFGGRY